MFGGSSAQVVMGLVLMFALPQLGGLLVTEAARVGWPAWPLSAVAVFAAFWHGEMWRPACRMAAESPQRCGMWVVALGFMLVAGVVIHLIAGTVFAVFAQRVRAARASQRRSVG